MQTRDPHRVRILLRHPLFLNSKICQCGFVLVLFPAMQFFLFAIFYAGVLAAQQGHDYTQADVDAGSRYYSNYCSGCHGVDGNGMQGANLSRGTFRRAGNDEELARIITNGIPGTPMPPAAFRPEQVPQIVAFLRAFPSIRARQTNAGNAARGKTLFEGKGECLMCHRVNGRGSRMGPDLSDIGELRRPAEIERSMTDPGAVVLAQNRTMRITTKDGKTIEGRLLNQDTQSIQILGPGEKPLTVARQTILNLADEKSPMPPPRDKLNAQEMADVESYLLTLKGMR
jgi:putative heme-binding domain-containing protein